MELSCPTTQASCGSPPRKPQQPARPATRTSWPCSVPMKAKRVARVMMAKAAIVGKDDDEDTQAYSSDDSSNESN